MIKTIIFDFGNVFINLDIDNAIKHTFNAFEIEELSEEMIAFNSLYEQGLISTEEFISFYAENFPKLSKEALIDIWNFMLKDFPKHRLDFILKLKEDANYNLILLSNTNALHIDWIKNSVPFFEDFKNCFHKFYLSHEINLSKPSEDIFNFVLKENKLMASECLFIDDNLDNCKTAQSLGLATWHINPETEDVSDVFKIKSSLF